MSYTRLKRPGLGQAKWIPGQVSFQALPPGRTSLPSLQPLIEAGLPLAPYVEHGSYVTGMPAIMRYGRDPYRGLGMPANFCGVPAIPRREWLAKYGHMPPPLLGLDDRSIATDLTAILAGASLIVMGQLLLDWGIGYTTVTTIVPIRRNRRRR